MTRSVKCSLSMIKRFLSIADRNFIYKLKCPQFKAHPLYTARPKAINQPPKFPFIKKIPINDTTGCSWSIAVLSCQSISRFNHQPKCTSLRDGASAPASIGVPVFQSGLNAELFSHLAHYFLHCFFRFLKSNGDWRFVYPMIV